MPANVSLRDIRRRYTLTHEQYRALVLFVRSNGRRSEGELVYKFYRDHEAFYGIEFDRTWDWIKFVIHSYRSGGLPVVTAYIRTRKIQRNRQVLHIEQQAITQTGETKFTVHMNSAKILAASIAYIEDNPLIFEPSND